LTRTRDPVVFARPDEIDLSRGGADDIGAVCLVRHS
jgi:hypothetical protein